MSVSGGFIEVKIFYSSDVRCLFIEIAKNHTLSSLVNLRTDEWQFDTKYNQIIFPADISVHAS